MSAVDALVQVNAASVSNANVSGAGLSGTSSTASPKKLHQVAERFEAMFMAEMLRQAHPKSNASGPFAPGVGEQTWQTFMDQALGQAVAAQGHLGLTSVIEKALQTAQQKGPSP